MQHRSTGWLSALAFVALSLSAPANEPLQYNRDIRPILSKHCFTCHGPDTAINSKAELRLDRAEAAREAGAIVPGDVAASEAIAPILSTVAEDLMPPPEAKLELSEAQKAMLKQWVAQGAKYEKHWAFIAPQRHAVPSVAGAPTSEDAFIRARLSAEGLSPRRKRQGERSSARGAGSDGVAPDHRGDRCLSGGCIAPGLRDDGGPFPERAKLCGAHDEPVAGRGALCRVRHLRLPGGPGQHGVAVAQTAIRAFEQNMPYDEFIRGQSRECLPMPRRTNTWPRLSVASIAKPTRKAACWRVRVNYVAEWHGNLRHGLSGADPGLRARCHDHKFDPVTQENYFQLSPISATSMNRVCTPVYRGDSVPQHVCVWRGRAGTARGPARGDFGKRGGCRRKRGPTPPAALRPGDRIRTERWLPGARGRPPTGFSGRRQDTQRGRRGQRGDPSPCARDCARPGGWRAALNGDNGLELATAAAAFDRYQPFSFSLWLRTPDHGARYVVFHRAWPRKTRRIAVISFSCWRASPPSAFAISGRGTRSRCRRRRFRSIPGPTVRSPMMGPLQGGSVSNLHQWCAGAADGGARRAERRPSSTSPSPMPPSRRCNWPCDFVMPDSGAAALAAPAQLQSLQSTIECAGGGVPRGEN